jgi:RNase H-like domain found in reverse transcriptase
VCLSFFKTLKKVRKFEWDEECNKTFTKLKEYLSNPPVMSRLMVRETLFLYLATIGGAMSAALVREEKDEQRPIYYVSRILRDAKTRYPPIEKLAFVPIITSRKLRPYFQAHSVWVLTKEPLKKALGCFDASGRLLKWAIELSEFDVIFHPVQL